MELMEASAHVLCWSHGHFNHQRETKPSLRLVRPPCSCRSVLPKLGMNSGRLSFQVNSAKWGSSEPSLGGKLKGHVEEGGEETEEECKEIGELVSEKCEKKDVVELLECLEKEAIMGDDIGREPNDYNRRALIFDKSSKVFKALRTREAAASKF